MIKYQHALNSAGKKINIESVVRETAKPKEKYRCLACQNELIPRFGRIRQHHFTHKKKVTCSGETYLHILGKELFYDEFKYCLENGKPFYIELHQKTVCNHREADLKVLCQLGTNFIKFNLLNYFNDIVIQKREGSFIPDVMLISKSGKDKIFVEIAVTHFSSEQKLSSDYRIIELEVEEEQDLNILKEHTLSICHSKIKFKNFHIKDIKGDFCDSRCEKIFNLFVVATDGRCILFKKSLNQISEYLGRVRDKISYYTITADNGNYVNKFKLSVVEAYKKKVKAKSCFLCHHHMVNLSSELSYFFNENGMLNFDRKPIYCFSWKMRCNPNHATQCEFYQSSDKHINDFLEGERLEKSNPSKLAEEYDYSEYLATES